MVMFGVIQHIAPLSVTITSPFDKVQINTGKGAPSILYSILPSHFWIGCFATFQYMPNSYGVKDIFGLQRSTMNKSYRRFGRPENRLRFGNPNSDKNLCRLKNQGTELTVQSIFDRTIEIPSLECSPHSVTVSAIPLTSTFV